MGQTSPSSDLMPEQPLDHGAWALRDRFHRGWIGCFSVKAGCNEYVRDSAGSVEIFPTERKAETAALLAHLDRLNEPRKPVDGKVYRVAGSGRQKRLDRLPGRYRRHGQ